MAGLAALADVQEALADPRAPESANLHELIDAFILEDLQRELALLRTGMYRVERPGER